MSALIEKYKEELRKGNSITLSINDLDNIKIDNTNKKIRMIDDLIMVHKTDFPPTGAIITPRESNKPTKKSDIISLDGEERDFEYSSVPSRNSIHFCLNGGVRSHPGGNCD